MPEDAESPEKLTPMMQQYLEVRGTLPENTLLLYRLGDFYEMFGADARRGSELLGLTLTRRAGQPMAGIPHHAANAYVQKILAAGVKVAICDQMEAPTPGRMIRRELTRILTPGTALEESQLEARHGNYLAALDFFRAQGTSEPCLAAAWLDLSSGHFQIATEPRPANLAAILASLAPREVILPANAVKRWKTEPDIAAQFALLEPLLATAALSPVSDYYFDQRGGAQSVAAALAVTNLEGFGIGKWDQGLGPAAALLRYAEENLRAHPANLRAISRYNSGETLLMDPATQKSLEILHAFSGAREGSLLDAIDGTLTAPGARLLEQYLAAPTTNLAEIRRRQGCVAEFLEAPGAAAELHRSFAGVRDLPRVLARLQNKLRRPRELGAVRDTLRRIPEILGMLAQFEGWYLGQYATRITDLPELRALLEKGLADELPADLDEPGAIRDGFDEKLDKLRAFGKDSRQWMAAFEAAEQEKTGIRNLRVRFNNAFGYYIEVTKANLAKVPPEYVRKQTTVGAERFTTAELREKEREMSHADERMMLCERELFTQLVEEALKNTRELETAAAALAELDAYLGWAEIARQWDYCQPEVDDSRILEITEGRHPIVERTLRGAGGFVPNDLRLDAEAEQIAILTGPNMAGKSTYIRQAALIALMAQIGCFVPAKSARVGLMDRIFSRVGASDDLAKGNSTFMVEMNETANILNNASAKSLVILDEIGRGTSTYDGLSIAWAVVEDLHGAIADPEGQGGRFAGSGPRTLFATHYHELTQIALQLSRVRNFRVAVKEWNDRIVFVRQVVAGAADKSYGIQVARLAGIPHCVVERAKQVLAKLEADDSSHNILRRRMKTLRQAEETGEDPQLEMF
jgi:DNA mismatch repair protein MutS